MLLEDNRDLRHNYRSRNLHASRCIEIQSNTRGGHTSRYWLYVSRITATILFTLKSLENEESLDNMMLRMSRQLQLSESLIADIVPVMEGCERLGLCTFVSPTREARIQPGLPTPSIAKVAVSQSADLLIYEVVEVQVQGLMWGFPGF